jgi:hypothetical protein
MTPVTGSKISFDGDRVEKLIAARLVQVSCLIASNPPPSFERIAKKIPRTSRTGADSRRKSLKLIRAQLKTNE